MADVNFGSDLERDKTVCPFSMSEISKASLSMLSIDRQRMDYCGSEDYDNCPLYISKILRRR